MIGFNKLIFLIDNLIVKWVGLIYECFVITLEAINLLDNKSFGGSMNFKRDIKKAFDTLDWKYLTKVLVKFGFDQKFCDYSYYSPLGQTINNDKWGNCRIIFLL